MTEDETLEPGMQQNILDAIFFLLHLCMAEFSCCLFDHLLYLLCAISYPSYQIGKNFTKICLLNCDAEGWESWVVAALCLHICYFMPDQLHPTLQKNML